jgi:hypothetical protein
MLSFLIHGRENQAVREGVLGVYDAVWQAAYPGFEAAFQSAAAIAYDNAAAAFAGERYEDAIAFSRKGLELSGALSKLLREYAAYTAPDDIERLAAPELSVPKEKSLLYLNTYYTAKTFAYFADAATQAVAYKKLMAGGGRRDMLAEWRGGRASLREALEAETKKRTELSAMANVLAAGLDGVKKDLLALPVYNHEIPAAAAGRALTAAQKELQRWADVVYADEHAGTARYYALQNASLEENLAQMDGVVASAQALMNGDKKTTENGEAFVAHYPAEALAKMDGITAQMDSTLGSAAGLLSSYEAESERLSRGGDIRRLRAATVSLQHALAALDGRKANRSALAKERADEAARLRQEGDRFFALAKEALRAHEFDKARANTAQTAERYNASLAIQEAESLRRVWDDQLTPLNTEIARTEYEMVVGEVRALVTRARTRYFEGEYENAEELLLRAVSRWAVVSTTPEDEVAYWLSMVRGALSLQSGRVIPATAPLYKSMSQLLNGAQKNYRSALALNENGKRAEAEKRLKLAKGQLREVMLLFPINREAGILDLRIDQILDAENFDREFETRLASAVTETKRGSREAYADMQNLAAVRPGYPGIERALYQAEIDIGLRQPPQETTTGTRAADLARRAQGMLDSPAQHNAALELVNEALRLNPNSTLAMNVKDRLQVAMARQNVAVIDRNAEQDYMRAVSELQKGNTIIALSIVQRLLQNPSNRNSVKINALRRRIEAMM